MVDLVRMVLIIFFFQRAITYNTNSSVVMIFMILNREDPDKALAVFDSNQELKWKFPLGLL